MEELRNTLNESIYDSLNSTYTYNEKYGHGTRLMFSDCTNYNYKRNERGSVDHVLNALKYISALIGSLFCYLFGVPDQLFMSLVTLMLIDILTGVLKAISTKSVNSSKMWKGMTKKVGTFAIIAVAVVIDNTLNAHGSIRGLAIGFYIATEGISIMENWASIGLPLPKKLIKVLEQLKGQADKE